MYICPCIAHYVLSNEKNYILSSVGISDPVL